MAVARRTARRRSSDPFVLEQHFIYVDRDGIIWDASKDFISHNWTLQKINGGGQTNGPATASSVFAFNFTEPTNEQMHYLYLDKSGTIWDSWHDGEKSEWNLQQINAGGNTNGPAATGRPFGWQGIVTYDHTGGNHFQQHITYRDTNGLIWDAWYQG